MDSKAVIESRNTKTNRQHNDQMEKHKRVNNDLQNTTQKTKDRETRTQIKTVDELR